MNRLRAIAGLLAASSISCFNPVGPEATDGSMRPDVSSSSPDADLAGLDAEFAGPDASLLDASIPDGGEEVCSMYSELPTCADGSFHFEDRLCLQMSGGPMCAEKGDGRCYPFCDENGGCAEGSTCGEIMLYRCTHYCWKAVRVCFPGPDVKYAGCEPQIPRDAGLPAVADIGL